MIRCFNVRKTYPRGQVALDDVSLEIERGELAFLTGSSGAGKSTLLKLIYREELPSDGQIIVNGRNVATLPLSKVPYLRRSIGIVFQNFRLIARKTVLENVCYLPRILGASMKEQRDLAEQALADVGLADRSDAFPLELSGGEQQRVALARALISKPELLIADEPTGNLDAELSREIVELLVKAQGQGTTVLVATHDLQTIERHGGHVLRLEKGRLVEDTQVAAPGAVADEARE